ncbi:acetylcholinesterase isoform X2 [Folsomia candida]|uniref:acetylcholinesterase isoform X2 n=1 Tax=Folsomia candida TaxID=158441 RepID=UPI0016052ED3|nr:acetylcholinesterase isoform X2 [Folsomia candida]
MHLIPAMVSFLALVVAACVLLVDVDAAPQQHTYDTFIKTNLSRNHHPSRHNNMNDHPDHAHRTGPHRHMSSTVMTTTGALRGLKKTVLEKDVHLFYGVPFAKPPLGPLRFKKPVPIEPWNGTLNAIHQPDTCYQEVFVAFPGFRGEVTWTPNTNISENCLYMNIWAPKHPAKKHGDPNKRKMPILVWIYGGGYVSGTATLDIYNADILAAENNVIVVVPQYRVGAFGFLYFGQEEAPGNMGLYDQTVAMQWIKDNAASFGGDPNSITVFGESAGGSSVTIHLLSPISRHLIDRGIIQSGTINAPWSMHTGEKARQIAEKLVEDCNCTNPDGSSMNTVQKIECLRDLPAAVISKTQWNSYAKILQFFSAPTIDGEFIPRDPMEMLAKGDFKKVPLLIGSNHDEGTYFILYDFIEQFTKEGPNCMDNKLFLDTVSDVFKNLTNAQQAAIRFQYTHWEDVEDPCKIRDKFNEFVADYYFICPTNRFAESYAEHGAPVYYYFFTQRTSSNPWGDWMGVMHADEIEYVFGFPLGKSTDPEHTWTTREKELSKRIMKYFTHFADTGKPVDDPTEPWPLYTKAQPNYFILNADTRGTGKGPRAHTCAFWNEFLPHIAPVPGDCRKLYGEISGASRSLLFGGNKSSSSSLLLLVMATLSVSMILSGTSTSTLFQNKHAPSSK